MGWFFDIFKVPNFDRIIIPKLTIGSFADIRTSLNDIMVGLGSLQGVEGVVSRVTLDVCVYPDFMRNGCLSWKWP